MKWHLATLVVVLVSATAVSAEEDFTVLTASPGESAPEMMLEQQLKQQAYVAIERRKSSHASPVVPECFDPATTSSAWFVLRHVNVRIFATRMALILRGWSISHQPLK